MGTVVWAFTTLLAAPTAPEMSLVLHVNFTAVHFVLWVGQFFKYQDLTVAAVRRCILRTTADPLSLTRFYAGNNVCMTAGRSSTSAPARATEQLSTRLRVPCAVKRAQYRKTREKKRARERSSGSLPAGGADGRQSFWQSATSCRIRLRYASSRCICSLTLSRAYMTVVWSFLLNSRAMCGSE